MAPARVLAPRNALLTSGSALLTSCSLPVLCTWPRAGTPSSAAGHPPAGTLYFMFSKREDSFPLSSSLFMQDKM